MLAVLVVEAAERSSGCPSERSLSVATVFSIVVGRIHGVEAGYGTVMMAEGIWPRVVPLATTAAIVRAFKTAGIELSAPSGLRYVAPDEADDAD